jgi:WD40 repeat protein
LVQEKWTATSTIKLDQAATAVDLVEAGNKRLLAVGTETGSIAIYDVKADGSTSQLLEVDSAPAHSESVNRVAWRPVNAAGLIQLASCSDDRSTRIYDLRL